MTNEIEQRAAVCHELEADQSATVAEITARAMRRAEASHELGSIRRWVRITLLEMGGPPPGDDLISLLAGAVAERLQGRP
jgi:hypothetical protein